MMTAVVLATAVSLTSGCETFTRITSPKTLEYELEQQTSLNPEQVMERYRGITNRLIQQEPITPKQCDNALEKILTDVTPLTVFGSNIPLANNPRQQIEDLWLFRQIVHNKLKDQKETGKWQDSCLKKVKQILNKVRLYEDQVVERGLIQTDNLESKLPFYGDFPYVIKPQGAKWTNFVDQLQSGDVIMRRTVSFDSAVIAKLSANGEFSHCTMVYKDKTGKVSFIEMDKDGLREESLDHYKARNNNYSNWGRLVVLRFEDHKLAKNAAEWLLSQTGKYAFDYSANMLDNSKLYCCEAISVAFSKAAEKLEKEVIVPTYLSNLGKLYDTPFIKLLGLESQQLFLPDDIELDHRFSYVGEWRNPIFFRKMIYQNVIFEKVFEWMVNKGYQHTDGANISGLASMVKFLRDDLGFFSSKMGENTPLGFIEAGLRYLELSSTLEVELEKIDNQKNPLSAGQLGRYLEKLREKDKEVYKNFDPYPNGEYDSEEPIFHQIFRPKNLEKT